MLPVRGEPCVSCRTRGKPCTYDTPPTARKRKRKDSPGQTEIGDEATWFDQRKVGEVKDMMLATLMSRSRASVSRWMSRKISQVCSLPRPLHQHTIPLAHDITVLLQDPPRQSRQGLSPSTNQGSEMNRGSRYRSLDYLSTMTKRFHL